jgi:hypothetical protein
MLPPLVSFQFGQQPSSASAQSPMPSSPQQQNQQSHGSLTPQQLQSLPNYDVSGAGLDEVEIDNVSIDSDELDRILEEQCANSDVDVSLFPPPPPFGYCSMILIFHWVEDSATMLIFVFGGAVAVKCRANGP